MSGFSEVWYDILPSLSPERKESDKDSSEAEDLTMMTTKTDVINIIATLPLPDNIDSIVAESEAFVESVSADDSSAVPFGLPDHLPYVAAQPNGAERTRMDVCLAESEL